jgi:hypothetical protein
MADDDSWKDQLAFVSGYILVFGFAVLKLWPLAAGFQTGMNLNFWNIDSPSQGVNTTLWVFWYLAFALGIALTAITLAIGHIMLRGFWLVVRASTSVNPYFARVRRQLGRLCDLNFRVIFSLLVYVGVYLALFPLSMMRAGIERKLVSSLSLSLRAAGWISLCLYLLMLALLVLILALAVFCWLGWFKVIPRIASALAKDQIPELASRVRAFAKARIPDIVAFSAAAILTSAMSALVIQTCYTAEIILAGSVFQRSRSDVIEVALTLGGSTSAANLARLRLADSRGMPLGDLSPQDLGKGHYISIIQSRDLQAGRYQVRFEYPHSSFDSSFPFLHRRVFEQRWFLVMP